MNREYRVALFREPRVKRGWLAYSADTLYRYTSGEPDKVVTIKASSMAQAKSKAISKENEKL